MLGRSHKPVISSNSCADFAGNNAVVAAPSIDAPVGPVSPMGISFDFELPHSNSERSSPLFSPTTPRSTSTPPANDAPTSPTGSAAGTRAHGGLQLLPHIPPLAVRRNSNSARRIMSGESQETGWNADDRWGMGGRGGGGGGNGGGGGGGPGGSAAAAPTLTRSKSTRLSSHFELDLDLTYPQRTPLSGTNNDRPRTAHADPSTHPPRMDASLFLERSNTPVMPLTTAPTLPSPGVSVVDSRDEPYSQVPKPFASMQGNRSSPDLLSSSSKTPVSRSRGPTPLYSNRAMSPQASLQDLAQRSNYSGSTARPSTRASSSTVTSAAPAVMTIGTPYGATADSFPLPQHVKTRPTTGGVISSVAGVTVPTHHTSGIKSTPKQSSKSETRKSEPSKKKGRLLNPLFLLQRRRSSQDPDTVEAERATREAQAKAVARQRDVVASGVNIPPPDFDPRIKGNVVHDFSAPRDKRNTLEESDMRSAPSRHESQASNPPMSPSFPPRHASLVNRGPRDGQRRSTHTPIFHENLDEDPDTSKRLSSIHAENLENKDFLQRASKHSDTTARSQESAVLPPFARRSQMLDAMQASFYHDDDSQRSSDPSHSTARDSPLSEVGNISPATARSSGNDAISPISVDATGSYLSRPISYINNAVAQDRPCNFESRGDRASQGGPHQDWASRPYSVVLAPPQIDTVADGSHDGSPTGPSHDIRAAAQEPRYLARGLSIRNTPSPGMIEKSEAPSTPAAGGGTRGAISPPAMTVGLPTPDQTPKSVTDASPRLVEKRKSAAGHSRKSSAIPKKHASNASRFSFQFGGESAAQEQALEEKHRKIASREITEPIMGDADPEEDEDDYFDEDAMDDMDELETQMPYADEPQSMLHPHSKPGDGSTSNAGTSQSSLYLQQAREALRQPESDDGSMYDDDEIPQVTDERDLTYADHPAFRTHSAMGSNSQHNSMMTENHDGYWRDSTIDSYMRDSYSSSAGQMHASQMTFDTSPGPPGGYALDYLSAIDRDSKRFSRPQSSLNVPGQGSRPISSISSHRPALPHRDSGNSERNRAVSGFSFSMPGATPSSERVDPMGDDRPQTRVMSGMSEATISDEMSYPYNHVSSQAVLSPTMPGDGQFGVVPTATVTKADDNLQLAADNSGKSKTSATFSTGLGLSNFADFDFGQQFTGMTTGMTIVDASDSEDESRHVDASHESTASVAPEVEPVGVGEEAGVASPPLTYAATNASGVQRYSESSPKAAVSSTTPATSTHTSSSSSWVKSPQFTQQRFGSPPVSHAPQNGHQKFASLSSPVTSSKSPVMPSTGRNASNHFPSTTSPNTGTQGKSAAYANSQDDMYFDDGNFEVDFGEASPTVGGFDESAFDDDDFVYRPNAAVNAPHGYGHRQQKSDLSYDSIGSDGPYPSFAVPNASTALARNSQMMLEDLPIRAPIDPKYIPQRNPSEDAKRLGFNDQAPPAPLAESGSEAFMHMQDSLQRYHAALAEAANRAASEGRFVRQASMASTVAGTENKAESSPPQPAVDTRSGQNEMSMYSQHDVGGSMPSNHGRNEDSPDRPSHTAGYSPTRMTFDFGFDQAAISDMDDHDDDDDDDLVAAANAEALASDDEGFYGQEFDFYGRPRAGSNELQAMNGGYWGPDGDDGLQRNKSSREPNLTPITERSEFSTRNSFVAGMPGSGLPSTNGYGHHSPALSRMPITPLMEENDITSFDELRRLRAQAFGGSNRSEKSSSNRSSQQSFSMLSPTIDTNVGGAAGHAQYGGSPPQYGDSKGSSGSSNQSSAKPLPMEAGFHFHDSPQSATSSNGNSFALDVDCTPKRNTNGLTEPVTAKKAPPRMMSPTRPQSSHSRSGSGADSINYVQEPDPEGSGRPRWVLERRRTSEQGQLELVGRELVQGGWI